jgi:osmotically-inducible protein OsmY
MNTSWLPSRRTLLRGAFVIACLPVLQGCFPLVALGVGAGAVMIADRRSSGAYVDDEIIEWKTKSLISQHFGSINHVNITSYNRNVLLTGEVESENARAEIQRLAATVPNVRAIINELVVAPPSPMSARSNDSFITTNVKTRFIDGNKFSANHIKIVTEANTVFLLGIVTHAEGEAAAEIARSSRGVNKVVKVFEYVDESSVRRNPNVAPRATTSSDAVPIDDLPEAP